MTPKDYGQQMRLIIDNMNSLIALKVEKYGIKQGQFEYFLLIFMNPGINQLALANKKNVSKSSVTKAINILENDGFIKRIIDKEDRRNSLLYLTDKGKKITDDLMAIKKTSEKHLFKGFNTDDMDQFYQYLSVLKKNSKDLLKKASEK
jgi:DNA-binding MarR family transcriptional regulator